MGVLLATAALETGHSVKVLRDWIDRKWLPFTTAPGTVKTMLVEIDDVKYAAIQAEVASGVRRAGEGRILRASLLDLRARLGLPTSQIRAWLLHNGVAVPAVSGRDNYLPADLAEAFDREHPEAAGKLVGVFPTEDPEPRRVRQVQGAKGRIGRPRKET